MSGCFCTGKCRELGYCPHTGRPSRTTGMFSQYCKECGRRMRSNTIFVYCRNCREDYQGAITSTPDYEFDMTDATQVDEKPYNNIEEGDEIWYKKEDNPHIRHAKVLEVKENVVKVQNAERENSVSRWRELDAIRIIEIEKQDNGSS